MSKYGLLAIQPGLKLPRKHWNARFTSHRWTRSFKSNPKRYLITDLLTLNQKEDYDRKCHDEITRYNYKAAEAPKVRNHFQLDDKNQSGKPVESIGGYSGEYYRSGLFSTIYKAYDPHQSACYALKLTIPSQCTPPHNPLREARILANTKSEHILPLVDSFHLAGGKFTLVSPFCPHDLDILLHSPQNPSLTDKQTTTIIRSLFAALAHLHALNIIHRDIKPSNILLESLDGPVYIADFGIAWTPNDPDSEPSNSKITDVGTTAYRPPELLFGHKAYGCELDLWAAGCVVAETVAGKPHPSLFDSGPLGSDLALIHSIFKTLGTPTNESWTV
ncbi:MAG: hypothetical protein Q9182_006124 [Xanthomendoza sp. 2 TL-2023]